jgi:hypothetical protein
VDVAFDGDHLDATKAYASTFRDNKFGSHPAHDDYGDESTS